MTTIKRHSGGALKTEISKGSGLFQTVVFSRKNTNHGPNSELATAIATIDDEPAKDPQEVQPQQLANLHVSPLSSIVHQADRHGKQNSINAPSSNALGAPRRLERSESEQTNPTGSFRHLFANIWSAFNTTEHRQEQRRPSAKRDQPVKPSSPAKNVVELRKFVIPPQLPQDTGKKCLVLDLDETLVHSSFKPTEKPDYIIPVEIDGIVHQVYVCKRPGADWFLLEMSKFYEIVVYTASLSKYADPLLDKLDPENLIRHRLFREHCVQYEGNYVKDLSLLDRDITQTIIIDNSPMSYLFHPRNAIGCSSFIDDMNDKELESIARFLTQIQEAEDVRNHLQSWDATY